MKWWTRYIMVGGVVRERLVVSGENEQEALESMKRIEKGFDEGYYLGRGLHGPFETEAEAKA